MTISKLYLKIVLYMYTPNVYPKLYKNNKYLIEFQETYNFTGVKFILKCNLSYLLS